MADGRKIAIELLFSSKGAKEAAGYNREVTKSVEDMTKKLKSADFSSLDTALSKFNRGSYSISDAPMKKLGEATKLTRMEALTLQYTFNDVTASLASGISPMTILLQQGGQVTQAFGGLKGTITTLTPLLLRWAPAIAAAAVAGGALFAVLKAPAIGAEAAKKITDIGDAADKAGVPLNRLQTIMKELVAEGNTPADAAKDEAVKAIDTLRSLIAESKKSQKDSQKGKKEFAKRLSVPGEGENPFDKADGMNDGHKYKTVRAPQTDKTGARHVDKGGREGTDNAPGLGKIEENVLDIPKKGAKKEAPNKPIDDAATHIGKDFPGATDVASKLKVDTRDLDPNKLEDKVKILERLATAYKALPDGSKKLEVKVDLDKELGKTLADIVTKNLVDQFKAAALGPINPKETISPEGAAKSKAITTQEEQNKLRESDLELKNKEPLLNTAQQAGLDKNKELDKSAQGGDFTTQFFKALGALTDTIDKIRTGDKQAVADHPIVADAFKAGRAMVGVADNAGDAAGAALAAAATDKTAKNAEAARDGLAAGEAIAKALAEDSERAANALERAAAASKEIKPPGNGNDAIDPSGGSGNSGFADGGFVSGPGTTTSDSIPAMLSNSEFVVKAASVQKPGVLGLLHAINGGASVPSLFGRRRGYADGGIVGSVPDIGGAGGGGTPIHVHFDGVSIGPMSASKGVVDQLLREEAKRRVSSAGKAPSRVG